MENIETKTLEIECKNRRIKQEKNESNREIETETLIPKIREEEERRKKTNLDDEGI